MKAIAGIIRAGRIVEFRLRDLGPRHAPITPPSVSSVQSVDAPSSAPLRNSDTDFIRRRARMLAGYEPETGNCINFDAAYDRRKKAHASPNA